MSDNASSINCSGVNVCVSLFDSLAHAFHAKSDGYGRESRIVLVKGINPKIVLGKLYLKNGTTASRIYFDSDTAVGKDRFERLPGVWNRRDSVFIKGGSCTKDRASHKYHLHVIPLFI